MKRFQNFQPVVLDYCMVERNLSEGFFSRLDDSRWWILYGKDWITCPRWWFEILCIFTPTWGNDLVVFPHYPGNWTLSVHQLGLRLGFSGLQSIKHISTY